ncbi:MAG: SDR family oxidoreductase [Saprospiraceae bacterium]|nr:SDR family oxidoreductase [Saprospiraceae bacterium]
MFASPIFADKTLLITGGGSGLGKAMATYFSQLGANVIISSRREDLLKEVAAEITSITGNKVLAVAADVRDHDAITDVIDQSLKAFGKIDGLINNAAGNFVSPTERLSHRAFESVIGIVLQGTINYTLALGKYWIEHKIPGNVLSIITTYAWTGTGYTVPSACAKAGVLALTRSLAVEWGRKYKIRLNAIAPGPFPTKGAWDRLFPESVRAMFDPSERIPMQRVGDKQELSNLAAYLMSDYANYINGEVVTIDGGEWLENGGQFNDFRHISDDMWDQLESMRKTKS